MLSFTYVQSMYQLNAGWKIHCSLKSFFVITIGRFSELRPGERTEAYYGFGGISPSSDACSHVIIPARSSGAVTSSSREISQKASAAWLVTWLAAASRAAICSGVSGWSGWAGGVVGGGVPAAVGGATEAA